MKTIGLHTDCATLVSCAGMTDTRMVSAIDTGFAPPPPPPPPPPQVVDFKRVTTTYILLFSRVSFKHVFFRHISTKQASRRVDTARRVVLWKVY